MKPIRWRKDRATVKGVSIRRVVEPARVWLDAMTDPLVCVSVRSYEPEHIDAAAYALADLVATLRGMG